MASVRFRPFPALLPFLFAIVVGGIYPDETPVLPRAGELTAMLGWTPGEAFAWLGAPETLFPYRDEAGEESVVFYFEDHTYLFWYESRVWQIRADRRWEGEVDGISMGDSRDEIAALWGAPINGFDDQPTWTLPDRGYPVRIRLYFDDEDRLIDLYVYRSDW